MEALSYSSVILGFCSLLALSYRVPISVLRILPVSGPISYLLDKSTSPKPKALILLRNFSSLYPYFLDTSGLLTSIVIPSMSKLNVFLDVIV